MKFSIATLSALLTLAACATSPTNHYYLLTPSPAAQAQLDKTRPAPAPQINLSIPAYLDRPQIVTQSGAGEVEIHEFDRWAEPVDGMIRRVLSQDMQAHAAQPLGLTIDSFIFAQDGITLRAHWTIASRTHEFAQTAPAGKDLASAVTTMSNLIDALAQHISATR